MKNHTRILHEWSKKQCFESKRYETQNTDKYSIYKGFRGAFEDYQKQEKASFIAFCPCQKEQHRVCGAVLFSCVGGYAEKPIDFPGFRLGRNGGWLNRQGKTWHLAEAKVRGSESLSLRRQKISQ